MSNVCGSPWNDDGHIDASSSEIANEVVTSGPGATRDQRVDLPHEHRDAGFVFSSLAS
jgi:hypothetical protein